ncbi:MAG: hypothetical protein M1274_11095 [Actinobacteria bacterium]|nr:hypothetical protein [Actinomycetota bacterium]
MGLLRRLRRKLGQWAIPGTRAGKRGRSPRADGSGAAIPARFRGTEPLQPDEAAELGAELRELWKSITTNLAVDRQIDPVLEALEERASQVRGRHYSEWMDTVDYLCGCGADDEALCLLLECVDAAQRASRVSGWAPAPLFTERAAGIYRRREDYAREVEVLERWAAACPSQRQKADVTPTQERMAKRLRAAKSLRAKQTRPKGRMPPPSQPTKTVANGIDG